MSTGTKNAVSGDTMGFDLSSATTTSFKSMVNQHFQCMALLVLPMGRKHQGEKKHTVVTTPPFQ